MKSEEQRLRREDLERSAPVTDAPAYANDDWNKSDLPTRTEGKTDEEGHPIDQLDQEMDPSGRGPLVYDEVTESLQRWDDLGWDKNDPLRAQLLKEEAEAQARAKGRHNPWAEFCIYQTRV